MSDYENFVQDFPNRCGDLLDLYDEAVKLKDGREVTLMLAIASSGFLIPYERLRPSSPDEPYNHPSQDRTKYPEAVKAFESLLKCKLMNSDLWVDGGFSSLCYGKIRQVKTKIEDQEELKKENLKSISSAKTAKNVLKIMRNALAHGNIFTYYDPIQALIFMSRIPETEPPKYEFLYISPNDFRKFLGNWFNFLKDIKISQEAVQEILITELK